MAAVGERHMTLTYEMTVEVILFATRWREFRYNKHQISDDKLNAVRFLVYILKLFFKFWVKGNSIINDDSNM